MSKEAYIAELRDRLRGLDEQDIEDALSYCEEYFEEAGEGNEQQVMDDLGTPAKFAAQIRAESTIRNTGREYKRVKNPHTSLRNISVIVLGICAMPIALPLAFAAVAVVFAMFLAVAALVAAAVVTFISVLASGALLIFNGFFNIGDIGNAFIAFGSGMLCLGFGTFVLILLGWLIKMLLALSTKLITGIYNKAKGGVRRERI